MGSQHAFLAAYGGGHIAIVIPLVRRLEALGWRVTLLALTTAAERARAAGISYIGFADLLHYAAPDSLEYGRTICPDIAPESIVSREETIAYHGINFAELAMEYGEAEAFDRFHQHGRQAFLPTNFMQRVLSDLQPDVVVATNSPRSEQATILAAGQLEIPSVCVVDMFALQEIEWIGQPGYATKVCVLNDAVKDMLVRNGRLSQDVAVTGNPAFETIALTKTVEQGHALRAARKWNDGRLNILWASQREPAKHPFTGDDGDPRLPRQIEASLRKLVADNSNARLIVRYHPNEDVSFAPSDGVVFSPPTEPLHALIHAVDLIVVTASTVGLEAWLAGKPVISVDASIFTADAPFSKMGISKGVETSQDLCREVVKLLGNRPVFPLVGQTSPPITNSTATDKIVAIIENLVARSAE